MLAERLWSGRCDTCSPVVLLTCICARALCHQPPRCEGRCVGSVLTHWVVSPSPSNPLPVLAQALAFLAEYLGFAGPPIPPGGNPVQQLFGPTGSYKQVFVARPPGRVSAGALMALFSDELLHTERVIEAAQPTRTAQVAAAAASYFGHLIGPRTWSVRAWRYTKTKINALTARLLFGARTKVGGRAEQGSREGVHGVERFPFRPAHAQTRQGSRTQLRIITQTALLLHVLPPQERRVANGGPADLPRAQVPRRARPGRTEPRARARASPAASSRPAAERRLAARLAALARPPLGRRVTATAFQPPCRITTSGQPRWRWGWRRRNCERGNPRAASSAPARHPATPHGGRCA